MKNAEKPAMPLKIDDNGNGETHYFFGLTKREYFAAMAMQGMLVNPVNYGGCLNGVVAHAVEIADRMLAELEEGNK